MTRACESDDLRARMRAFYGSSQAYQRLLDEHGEGYQASFVALVRRFAPPGGRILELGAGNGVAARMLHRAGFRVVATDVSPLFLRHAGPYRAAGLAYAACDGLELPFRDGAFDFVCSNEYLEHVPDAPLALSEMARMTAPGGGLLVAGPNLCSPLVPLRELVRLLRGRSDGLIWCRTQREAARLAWENLLRTRAKKRAAEPEFLYRQPHLEERVVGGDADSAYLSSPLDIVRFLRDRNWRIVASCAGVGWRGRLLAATVPNYSPYLCVVAQKPAATGR
jgi:2-polyprenyl-3-methyl-5-hydroxy-6-metoxy-1,4-benzoquinol methylase